MQSLFNCAFIVFVTLVMIAAVPTVAAVATDNLVAVYRRGRELLEKDRPE